MTDNIFDRLAELFQSSGPVNWRLAREIAESAAGAAEPVDPWLADEYLEMAATAALRIDADSPLDTTVLAPAQPIDRRTWAGENVNAFAYLAEPVAEKLAGPAGGPMGSALQPLGPALLGLQMGAMVGFMSNRILGLFDVGLPTETEGGPSFVVPNVESFASDHGIDARQARLWAAIHEVTHHSVFALPWTREHFLMLAHQFAEGLEVDPEALQRRIDALADPEQLQHLMDDPSGLTGIFAGAGADEVMGRMQAFMAVVEGYADHLMGRAAAALVPEADRIRQAIGDRRSEPSEGEQVLTQMLGLDLETERHRLGGEFCAQVDRRWGSEALDRIWEGPELLPTRDELEDVVGWAARTLL